MRDGEEVLGWVREGEEVLGNLNEFDCDSCEKDRGWVRVGEREGEVQALSLRTRLLLMIS